MCGKFKVAIHKVRAQVNGGGVLTKSVYLLFWWRQLFVKMRASGESNIWLV